MPIYTIYKATNLITGKHYVGFDKIWPDRLKDHLNESKNPKYLNYYFELHKAIRKYGKEAFIWEIIYQSYDGLHTLKEMEGHFIKEYNSYYLWPDGGYNMTLGGEGNLGHKHTTTTKEKISKAHLGLKHSEETKFKLRLKNKGRKLKLTDEQIKQRSEKTKKARQKNNWSTKKKNGIKIIRGGISQWTKEQKQNNAKRIGEMYWWNNGYINKKSLTCPGLEYNRGRFRKHI